MRRHLRFCADGRRIKRRLSNKKFLLFIGKQYQRLLTQSVNSLFFVI